MNVNKIILADDDEDDQIIFKEALAEIQDIQLLFAKNGTELMDIISNADIPPDLIFFNPHICHIEEYNYIETIKQNPQHSNIPLVIFTDSTYDKHIDEVFNSGATLYIVKPVAFKKLKQLLTKVFELDIKTYLPQPARENFVLTHD